jgi:ABC-type dipeptide/oligopeptide/nickel transport system permease component
VAHLIAARYPYTLALTLTALGLGLALALPAGIVAAVRRGRWADQVLSVVSLFGLSVPGLALGPVLILVFSIELGWLPVSGANAGGGRRDRLALSGAAVHCDGRVAGGDSHPHGAHGDARRTGQDYIRTARAKGLSETRVVCRHALPNALVPIVTVVGLQFGALLAGAIVTETIFSWPGLGRLTVSAISNRDYALVQGCLLSIGLTYVLVNLLTDVVYRWVNPRMRGYVVCSPQRAPSLLNPSQSINFIVR